MAEPAGQVEVDRGSAADLPLLEPLWVSVHHRHAESMPELAPYVDDARTWAERSALYAGLLAKPDTVLLLARSGTELVGYGLAHVMPPPAPGPPAPGRPGSGSARSSPWLCYPPAGGTAALPQPCCFSADPASLSGGTDVAVVAHITQIGQTGQMVQAGQRPSGGAARAGGAGWGSRER
jgi:hypothetical protein